VIVLWGLMEDGPLAAVAERLTAEGLPWLFVDQRETLECSLRVALDQNIDGELVTPGGAHRISSIAALYWRPYDFEQVLGFEPAHRGGEAWRQAAAFEDSMTLLAQHAQATVVNRPSSIRSNNSKPHQLAILRRAGFSIPATLISSEPESVLRFWREHKSIIYKSVSSCRSIVARFNEGDLESLSAITCCPTQFQQYIPGTDYRVHVVGDRVFAHRITSAGDDYRYAKDTTIEMVSVPEKVSTLCVEVTKQLGLEFSGIDLRRSPDDEWFCFEMNPSPGFTYFDREHAICDALVQHLSAAPVSDRVTR
jgi:ribosomal protein S6-L-glutamate ligase RimK-like protein